MVFVNAESLITADKFNELAEQTNRIYHDVSANVESILQVNGNTPTNSNDTDLIFFISENDPAFQTNGPGSGPFILSKPLTDTSYIVVEVDFVVNKTGYSIDLNTNTITFSSPLPPASRIAVFNRGRHRFGWGNNAVTMVESEEVIHSNDLNQIVDRTNIMLYRNTGGTEVNRLVSNSLISAQSKNFLDFIHGGEILFNENNFISLHSSLTTDSSFSRTDPWQLQLIGVHSFEFDDYAQARYFFNSGGQLRARLNVTGDLINIGTAAWKSIADSQGSIIMDYKTVRQTGFGGTSNLKGFYDLTTEWQTVFRSGGPAVGTGGSYESYGEGSYSSIRAEWNARHRTDANGKHIVDVQVIMDMTEYSFGVITGEIEYIAQTVTPDGVTRGPETFSIIKPEVTVLQDFNSSGNE